MSEPEQTHSAETATAKPARKGRWLRRGTGLVIGLIALVFATPYILALAPFRDWLLGSALAQLDGTVHSSSATFGWFQPVALYDFEIVDPDGQTLLSVDELYGDKPLWRLLFNRSDWGVFRVVSPKVEIVLREGGSNLRDVFGRIEKRPSAEEADRLAGGAAIGIDIISGKLAVRRKDSQGSWSAQNIEVSARLDPARAGQPRDVVVEPGRLLDHISITPQVCDDFLKFVAPTLAKVARAGGSFSLEVDKCVVPLGKPRDADVAGRLTLHEIDAGPGPMVEKVAEMFHVPQTNQLAHEEVIRFQVKDERVYHEGFALELGTMNLATQGSVSLADQSLDITLAIRLPEFANKNAPVRAALSGQTLTLPIRGTLGHPEISPEAIRASGFGLLAGVVDALAKNRPITADAIQQGLREGKLLGQSAAGAGLEPTGPQRQGWWRGAAGGSFIPDPGRDPARAGCLARTPPRAGR